MKVSIIVPCYSVASKLPRCVHNLLAQTFTDWELIAIALQRTMLIFMPYTKKTVVSVQPEIQELR